MQLVENFKEKDSDTPNDIKVSHHARSVFNLLNEFLSNNSNRLGQGLEKFQQNSDDSYILPMGQFLSSVGYNIEMYGKLYIIFAASREGKDGSLTPMPNGTYNLIMYIIDNNDPNTIAENFSKLDDVFVHELTHFLDSMRSGSKKNTKSTNLFRNIKDPQPNELRKYYSTPEEYNAFFQQSIDSIELWMLSNQREARLALSGSFVDFAKIVLDKNLINKHFYKFLNSKYGKKLRRRLYKYFDYKRSNQIM